jgi:hypothetical protein
VSDQAASTRLSSFISKIFSFAKGVIFKKCLHRRFALETISPLNAASISLDVEKPMIEKKFFEIFDLTDAQFRRFRTGLEKATSKHRQKLEKLFSELSKN